MEMAAPLRGAKREALRTPRAAAVAGIIFAVLLSAAMILVRLAVPESSDIGTWVIDESKRRLVLVALNLLPFAGIAFLWFIGVLRDRIGEGEDRLFATVFLGSGLLFVAMLFVSGAIAGGMITTAEGSDFVSETSDLWEFGRRSTLELVVVYGMRMAAVFTMSTTTLAMRLGVVPRWLAIHGYITAGALLLGSGNFAWLELMFPAWVLVLSVHMLIVTRVTDLTAESGATVVASLDP
jgi:hypothetical protein